MIFLPDDFLLFETDSGESVPFSADMIAVELTGEAASFFDADFVKHAAAAVFHHFRHDLKRTVVTLGEFSEALEKILGGFLLNAQSAERAQSAPRLQPSTRLLESDLRRLADESGRAELLFFPRLRDELRAQLQRTPHQLHFCGLRDCVKHLVGARRWSPRCRALRDQIVEYLRDCLGAESVWLPCALVVV
jgi:hypothetical protein